MLLKNPRCTDTGDEILSEKEALITNDIGFAGRNINSRVCNS